MKQPSETSAEKQGSPLTVPLPSDLSSRPCSVVPGTRRAGKEPLVDDRTAEEKAPIIINLAEARGLANARLVAVGVFLSILTIPSKQLVNYMKNVWKIRGSIEMNPLAAGRFILEFSEEGDFDHVTRGGPWRYQKDAVLIRPLKDHEDPNEVRFETVPIWAQFTKVPFYLLSKQLVRELGKRLGQFIIIDNNARGDIQDKILRARVHLPIARPLQRWITLMDEFTDEEVVVAVLYERLPSFCLSCGIIGHREANCDLPATLRRRRYNEGLSVPPTPIDDPRKWFLPESARHNGRAMRLDAPWRNVAALGPSNPTPVPKQLAIVANITLEVEKLTVKDDENREVTAGINSNNTATMNSDKNCQNNTLTVPVLVEVAETGTTAVVNINTSGEANTRVHSVEEQVADGTGKKIKKKLWKRKARENDNEKASGQATEIYLKDTHATKINVLGKRSEIEGGMQHDERLTATTTRRPKVTRWRRRNLGQWRERKLPARGLLVN